METNRGNIPGWIYGRRDSQISNAHNTKINEGFKNLPNECQILSVGKKLEIDANEKTQSSKIGRKQKVTVKRFKLVHKVELVKATLKVN